MEANTQAASIAPSATQICATRTSKSSGIDYSKWDRFEVSDSDEEEDEVANLEKKIAATSVSKPAATPTLNKMDDGAYRASLDRQHAKQRQHIDKMDTFSEEYLSQHCAHGDSGCAQVNLLLDSLNSQGMQKIAPNYKSGINPNYFEEYFSNLPPSDITNTAECKIDLWGECQSRRWSYCGHLAGYHDKLHQKIDVNQVEFWRRFHLREKPPRSITEWYFDGQRILGDVLPDLPTPFLGYQTFCPKVFLTHRFPRRRH